MATTKRAASTRKKAAVRTVLARSAHVPGKTRRIDAVKFQAMRKALLKAVPRKAPGLSDPQMIAAVKRAAPRSAFPDGGKIAWWMKLVQEDLEARKILAREKGRPVRWHRTR